MAGRDGRGHSQPQVNALLRGLKLLRVLNEGGALTATAVARQSGLSRITVYRLLQTLELEGYVRRGDEKRYALGPRVLELSNSYSRQNWLLSVAATAIQDTARALGWPLVLSTNHGPRMLVQHATMDKTGFWLKLKGPGSQLPLLSTAMGLAYLSHAPPQVAEPLIRAALEQDGSLTPEYVRNDSRLTRILESARRSGVVSVRNAGESDHVSLSAVAVPVLSHRTAFAAIALVYYSAGMFGYEAVRKFGPPLQNLASRIGAAL
jgi:IclR family mhp operon transcriptional activator